MSFFVKAPDLVVHSRGVGWLLRFIFSDATMSASADTSCYTVVFEDSSESPSVQELRSGLEKGSDEVKFDTLRKIIVSTINGNALVYWPA
jgi:hypothetical protein